MHFSHYVMGLVLIHCTSTTHGIMEHAREIVRLIQIWIPHILIFYKNFKFMNLRLDDGQMNESAWKYLFTHRFGNVWLYNKKY
jgi:hypothetical protein